MRTPAQSAASRANGAKSKGPTSARGKQNSSRNRTSHGLFAETIVLDGENFEAFLQLHQELIEEHAPKTSSEVGLVETITAARWRMDRIWSLQKVAFETDIEACGQVEKHSADRIVLSLQANPDRIRTHELLLRYEIALGRQIHRALMRLSQLQDRRNGNDTSAERTRQSSENKTPPSAKSPASVSLSSPVHAETPATALPIAALAPKPANLARISHQRYSKKPLNLA